MDVRTKDDKVSRCNQELIKDVLCLLLLLLLLFRAGINKYKYYKTNNKLIINLRTTINIIPFQTYVIRFIFNVLKHRAS